MDIEFFKQDGPHGVSTAGWSNAYEYITVDRESAVELLLKDRGFLFEANRPHEAALVLWRAAQDKMPQSYSDRLRTGPITTAVPTGTKLWLTLPNLPRGYAWGRATLNGQTAKAAWDEIGKYLRAGASQIAHANAAAMVDHVINTSVRKAAGIAHAATDGAGKSLSGDLYFRVHFMDANAVLPVAPDGKGQSTFESWVRAYNASSLQLSLALGRYRHDISAMGDDLQKLAQIDRVLSALFDMGNLALMREPNKFFGDYHPLVHDAVYCHRQVILGSLPGGRFGFPWSLNRAPSVEAILDQRAAAVPIYKQLRAAYRKAPAVQVAVVNDVCALEAKILSTLLAQGNVPDALYQEIVHANDWIGSAGGGDPPDDTKGLGVLFSMLLDSLPPGLDAPSNLYQLVATTLFADGVLSDHAENVRAALENRIKAALSSALALPSDLRSTLKEPSGWTKLEEAYKTGVAHSKQANVGARDATRVLDYAGKEWKSRIAKLKVGPYGQKDVLAGLRLIGFVATGIGLVDDIVKLGHSAASDGDWGRDTTKLTKDTLSAFGTFARDYFSTRKQMANWPGLGLEKDEVLALEGMEKAFKPAGIALGAVSGVWSAGAGLMDRNTPATIAGVANALGYGIRVFVTGDSSLAVFALERLSPWLLIAGASVDILNALGPAKGDALMRKQAANMMKSVSDTLRNWYDRRPPWRASPSPDFEEMLKNVDSLLQYVDQEDAWSSMLGSSEADVTMIRERLVQIGFSKNEAQKLAPIEHSWDYLLRKSAPAPFTGNWPALESE